MNNKAAVFFNTFFKVLIGILGVANMFVYSYPYFSDGVDYTRLEPQQISVIVLMIIVTVAILLLFRLLKENRITVIVLLLVSLITKTVWMINWPLEYYYDMSSVLSQASDFYTIPDFLPIEGFHYLKVYDYNIPLVLIDLFYMNLAGLENVYIIARCVNLISLLMIDLAVYLISRELFDNRTAVRALLLSVLFFPFTAMIAVIYNDVTSCVLFVYAVYFFIKYIRGNQNRYMIISILFLVTGNTLRSLGIIFLIAFVLYLLFTRWKKAIVYCIISISLMFISSIALNTLYYNMGILDQSEGSMRVPVTHYLAIGSSKGVNGETPGYYSSYLNDYFFINFSYDPEEFREVSADNLRNNLEVMDTGEIISHYSQKYLMQWTDGTFETALINDFISNKSDSPLTYEYETSLFTFVTMQEHIYSILINYSNAYWLMILIAIAVVSFVRKGKDETIVPKVIIMGIMAFYILWEISPHYSFVALPYFIILAGYSLTEISDFAERKISERKTK